MRSFRSMREAMCHGALLGAISIAACFSQTATGGLTGELRSSIGQAAVKGRVQIVRAAPFPSGPARAPSINGLSMGPSADELAKRMELLPIPHGGVIGRAQSDAGGKFDASFSFAGGVMVCVEPDDTVHLDPCKWGNPRGVAVAAGRKDAAGAITLQKGVPLRVIIQDPEGLLGDQDSVRLGMVAQIGFYYPNGIFEPMKLESSGELGVGFEHKYAVAIPPGKDIRVGVLGQRLRIADEAGNDLSLGRAANSVRAREGETERVLRFRVVGLAVAK